MSLSSPNIGDVFVGEEVGTTEEAAGILVGSILAAETIKRDVVTKFRKLKQHETEISLTNFV